MTEAQFVTLLQRGVVHYGGQRAYARHLRISPMYLNDILNGRRAPGDKVLKATGHKREVRIIRTVRISKQ